MDARSLSGRRRAHTAHFEDKGIIPYEKCVDKSALACRRGIGKLLGTVIEIQHEVFSENCNCECLLVCDNEWQASIVPAGGGAARYMCGFAKGNTTSFLTGNFSGM